MKLSYDNDETKPQRFPRVGESCIEFRDREFESTCFGNRTTEILDWNIENFPDVFAKLVREERFKQGDFLYVRLPATDTVRIRAAERAGFYYAETSIIPSLHLRGWKQEDFSRYIWPTECVGEDSIGEVEEIARSTFKGLRFNLDPFITEEQANRRYSRWLRNAYEGGEDVQVIRYKGKIAGFSLLRNEGSDKVVWRLAGLHSDLKTSGLGIILYASTVAYCKDRGIKHIDGGVSVANTPVLNVLSSVGFSFKEPTIVLHYYVD